MAKSIKMIEAKVISQKGTCALGHKVGDVVRFTETGVDGKICIHALYSMLPAVFAMLHEAHFPWLKDPDVKTHACPDAFNPLVFEVFEILFQSFLRSHGRKRRPERKYNRPGIHTVARIEP